MYSCCYTCYTNSMNNPSLPRTLAGSIIILIGLIALLGGFDLLSFGSLFATYWPTLVIAGGLLILLANPREQYAWALLFIVLGILWQMRALGVVDFNVWALFWPLVLIAIGWSTISNRAFGAHVIKNSKENTSAILGSVESKVESSDFKGNKVTVILGGSSIDLRNATIKKEATLEVFALMGGIEVKVPEGWLVQSSVMPILGGLENKTAASTPKGKSTPTLNIVGTTILGGIEISN